MRVLVFHGYLLHGTGSNVYNARLAVALARAGHEVHLLSQEADPATVPGFGTPGIHVHRPDIGRTLPVYVADAYAGLDAVPFPDLDDAALAHYLEANVAAVREVAGRVRPDVALANHLVMGPAILARGLPEGVPYAVKVHGSALEYVVRPHRERFLPYALEGLARARTVLVGSRHTAEALWDVVGDPALPGRTRLGPPGVDTEVFRPRPREEAAAGVRDLAGRLAGRPVEGEGSFARDPDAIAAALRRLDLDGPDRHVLYVGKLIVSKGVDVLLTAWPLVLAAEPRARLVVVGFGAYRAGLERLLAALAAGDLATVRELAAQGRGAEGGVPAPLTHLTAFLDALDADPAARTVYLEAAAALAERVVVVGRLDHDELAPLLAACEAQVVPSTFPEAFGMVAAEAAACGALPVVADHSGLAEVAQTLRPALPDAVAPLLTTLPGNAPALAEALVAWLATPGQTAAAAREALVAVARERFGWDGVARGVVAAALGDHDALPPVPRA